MARQSWSSQLRNAQTYAEQAAVLRVVKNEVIGHTTKKEAIITSGDLEAVVRLTSNKSSSRGEGKAQDHTPRPLEQEEAVRLQCLQILASIAQGQEEYLMLDIRH